MNKQRVSIKDIAESVGVSHPTVSRALRGQGRMSDSTRQRILIAAEEMGYTPSLVARGLVTQRSFCIGLIVPQFADPFHSTVAQGLEAEARKQGYSLFVASTEVDIGRAREVIRSFQGRQVDGIVISSMQGEEALSDLLHETGIPFVFVNPTAEIDNTYTILHDDYGGSSQIAQHLLAHGRRRLAYCGNERGGRADRYRREALEAIINEADLPSVLVEHASNGRINGGVEAANSLLQRIPVGEATFPDAICAFNDTMAIGILSVLRRHQIQVPHDVAVVGFDDLDVSEVTYPPLTTFRQPRHNMGMRAMHILQALITQNEQSEPPPMRTLVPGELIIREST